MHSRQRCLSSSKIVLALQNVCEGRNRLERGGQAKPANAGRQTADLQQNLERPVLAVRGATTQTRSQRAPNTLSRRLLGRHELPNADKGPMSKTSPDDACGVTLRHPHNKVFGSGHAPWMA